MSLTRWITGAAICVALIAVAAYALVDIGAQRRGMVPAPPADAVKATAPPRTHRVTPESEIITELKDEPSLPGTNAAARLKPAWAAQAVRPPTSMRLAASMPTATQARTPAVPGGVHAAAVQPAVAVVVAPRAAAAELCQDQSGIARAMCLARRCSDAALRSSPHCAPVRDAEQRIRERMEQGG